MNSNNFIEIKINMEHVFLGLLPPTHLTTHTFLPTQTPGDPLSGPPVLSTAQRLMKDRTLNLGDPQMRRMDKGSARHNVNSRETTLLRWQVCSQWDTETRNLYPGQEPWVLSQIQPLSGGWAHYLTSQNLHYVFYESKLNVLPIIHVSKVRQIVLNVMNTKMHHPSISYTCPSAAYGPETGRASALWPPSHWGGGEWGHHRQWQHTSLSA